MNFRLLFNGNPFFQITLSLTTFTSQFSHRADEVVVHVEDETTFMIIIIIIVIAIQTHTHTNHQKKTQTKSEILN